MADPNPFRQVDKGPANKHGKKYEKRLAGSLGAKLQPGSGSGPVHKGDMKLSTRHAQYLLEAKTTTAKSIALELGWLVKISEEAQRMGRLPALAVAFVPPDGRPHPQASLEWVMVPKHVFQELTE